MKKSTKKLVYSAVIAAIYAALTMVLAPISYGAVQFRISEVLCVLPFFVPAYAWSLFIGCAIANVISAVGILDVVVGSLATLLAGLCTAAIGRAARKTEKPAPGEVGKAIGWGSGIAACAMPVLFNGPIVGAELAWLFPLDEGFWHSLIIFGAQVAAGEAVVMFAGGLTILRVVLKNERFRSFFESMN